MMRTLSTDSLRLRLGRHALSFLLLCGCTASTAASSRMVRADEDDSFRPIEQSMAGEIKACPRELQAAVKQCSLSLTVTQNGEYAICYCDAYGNRPVKELSLKPGERNLVNATSISITKINKPGDPTDPCITFKIDGVKQKVCW